MGTCNSRQTTVVIADNNLRTPAVECRQDVIKNVIDPGKLSMSMTSHATGSRSSDPAAEGARQAHHATTIPEESITAIISDVSVPRMRPPTEPTHVRKTSSVKEYLQAEGASCNRLMVHIETPFGLPIEEVYDGVHTGDVLGEGITGSVRLITHRVTGIQRAVKRLDLKDINSDDDMDRLLDEIKIMCCLDHPNVVCLEEVFEGENELFLTQELCDGGDLFDRLGDQLDERYTEARCARVIKQIISSVSYLHSKDIVHRDLKLENFLFSDNGADSELKMIDFGFSKHFVKGEELHETVGTPYTVAPEVILGKGYDEKCDVWAIGVITFLLLGGYTPFGGDCPEDDLNEVRLNIISGHVSFEDPVWRNVSEEAISFIKSLLVLDPQRRPKSSELKDHPWLKSMKRNSSHVSCDSDESSLSQTVVNGLLQFKNLSYTRKFLREIISYTLQPDQLTGLHEEFEKIDVDDKGEISLHCFKEALIATSDQHHLTEVEIEEIFNGLKVRNTDMSIRWHEFIAACLSQCQVDDRNIRLAFDRLDNERKGFITLSDLKIAMDFYGSDSRYDLQSMWINNIIDYKYDKEHMTYDDFYKLLTLDKDRECPGPMPLLRKSNPPKRVKVRSSLARSYINKGKFAYETYDEEIDDETRDDPAINRSKGRRHTLGPESNRDIRKIFLDGQEPSLVSNVKASRNIHDFILEASKRVEDENKKKEGVPERRVSITGTRGLFLRKETSDDTILRTLSSS
ncbi:hypothetical protein ACHAXR_009295 [Thalassiosira sp. AJA248-18]